ncbi:MAG: FAD/NAD(P)-binding oxidoreductase, partial [Bacteroidota bacterium]
MHVAIIGNGISGITAARFIRKLSDHKITVISSETDHFFSRTALMYIYMGHMRFEDTKPYENWFWEKNRIELKRAYVKEVNTSDKELIFSDGERMHYDKLVLACGSTPNKFGWPGQDLDAVHGLYSYQDLEAMEQHSEGLKRAVIVGGGLIGIEMAEMFHSRNIHATFLVREKSFWNKIMPAEESAMINRHIFEHHLDLRLGTELKEIIDDGKGKACAAITSTGERIDCGFVGLTAGVHPNINFLEGSGIETKRGILVNEYLETNIEDIYAIGDCAEAKYPKPGRRPIEAIWYTGRMMGETVAYNICNGKTEYDPGIWFNSAKFLDIEYQVYGDVQSKPPENHTSIYWEHADGRKSIRIVYDKDTNEILGFNL